MDPAEVDVRFICRNMIFRLVRYIFMKLSPEVAHRQTLLVLKAIRGLPFAGKLVKLIFGYKSKTLKATVFGLEFDNPVGLAAGLDPNAELCDELSWFGFSFLDVGAITPLPEEGNPKPRIFPLIQDKALVNRIGLRNKGVSAAIENLKKSRGKAIISANIAHNLKSKTLEAIKEDYYRTFSMLYDFVDILTVNISFDSDVQKTSELAESILDMLLDLRICYDTYKPILIKVSPDMPQEDLDKLLKYCMLSGVDGVVAGNATQSRDSLQTSKERINKIGKGFLSGAPLFRKNLALVRHIVEYTRDRLPVIACGGIMSPEQAQEMLDAGAALVEMLTGIIYEGPGLVKKTLKHLEKVKPSMDNQNS